MFAGRPSSVVRSTDCARRFPSGQLIFDAIPPWLSKRTLKGWRLTDRYTAPRMPFGCTVSEAARLPHQIPSVAAARDVVLPPGRGAWKSPLLRTVANLPVLRDQRPSLTALAFAR
jgi:hypothetical protein